MSDPQEPQSPDPTSSTPAEEPTARPEPETPEDISLPSIDTEAQRMKQISRRSFMVAAAGGLAAFGAWEFVKTATPVDGMPWPLRRILGMNERLAKGLSSPHRLSREYPVSEAQMPRFNGELGLEDEIPRNWRLKVIGLAAREPIFLSLDDIRKLPRVDVVTQLHCIEGWSVVVHWAGARLSDLVARFPVATSNVSLLTGNRPNSKTARYVSAATPNENYYVSLDIQSALHPQTLLCYELNGQPLTPEHGAPLRLSVPVKYGIKSLKRLGTLRFVNKRPSDYWGQEGYDYYAGF